MSAARSMLRGGVSGLVAVAPMTLTMTVLHGKPPWHPRDPLPPREITEELAERAGVRDEMNDADVQAASTVGHVAFGAASGAVYGVTAGRLGTPRVASGVLFALSVWALSYMGWLPALGILPHAAEQPAGRNRLMVLAHVVWGACMGLTFATIDRRRRHGG